MIGRACSWPGDDSLMRRYHDTEWGAAFDGDDNYLFEMLCLEGAQAGLSWITVLRKREEYRKAFRDFDITACADLSEDDLERIRNDYGIIKNRAKIRSVRGNAQAVLRIQSEWGSFAAYLRHFVDGKRTVNHWEDEKSVPASSELSTKISEDLRRRGVRFAGPVILYSYLQAVGLIDDHIVSCPYHSDNRATGKETR